ncbi:hypothetical protein EC973_008062 [Apophysomyces ossiformis]|uniref:Uncharacterized protein n=1 Tax=Apophysomyces ossiformis TaxID=679940 RepID=A0A8H7EPF0_9FUNG|nr:hypothetical protein EC973_008062 [Apophysomyces ossiformis]
MSRVPIDQYSNRNRPFSYPTKRISSYSSSNREAIPQKSIPSRHPRATRHSTALLAEDDIPLALLAYQKGFIITQPSGRVYDSRRRSSRAKHDTAIPEKKTRERRHEPIAELAPPAAGPPFTDPPLTKAKRWLKHRFSVSKKK